MTTPLSAPCASVAVEPNSGTLIPPVVATPRTPAELRQVRWLEGKYGAWYAFIKKYRVGNVYWHGGSNPDKKYKVYVSVFSCEYEGFFPTLEDAKAAVPEVVEMFLNELFK